MKGKLQILQKKFLAVLLASAIAMSSIHMPISAMDMKTATKQENQYNESILREIQNLCSEGERAEDVLDILYKQGFVDQTGMPIVGGTYEVDGKKLTEEQLIKEAAKHQSGKVVIDGTSLTWEEVNALLRAKKAIQEIEEYMNTGVTINESNQKKYQSSLDSLKSQIMAKGLNLTGIPLQSSFGAGISHQVRATVTTDSSSISETGAQQKVTVHVKLDSIQKVPVTFQYRAVSGTGQAEGSGTVTIPEGEESASFSVTYMGNQKERKGVRKFYVQCYDIKNALFTGGEAGGKSTTLEFDVTKNDPLEYIHTIVANRSIGGYTSKKENCYYGQEVTFTIAYKDMEKYLAKWEDNSYKLKMEFNAIYHPKCEESKDLAVYAEMNGQFQEGGKTYNNSYPYQSYNKEFEKKIERSKALKQISEYGNFDYNIGRRKFSKDANWRFVTFGAADKNGDRGGRFETEYDVNSPRRLTLTIREIHENVNLIGLTIPDGTFYAGQSVPITATFDEKIKLDDTLQLHLTDGTVLTPEETGTLGESCVFLYKVPTMPSGAIPGITKLEMKETRSFSTDVLKIPGQDNTVFDIEKAITDYPDSIVRSNEHCQLRPYKDASFTDITCLMDGDVASRQWVAEVFTIDQTEEGAYRKWIQGNCAEIARLDLKKRKDLKSGEQVQAALANTSYSMYANPSKYQIAEYVKSMYLSVDGGITRIPLYVVAQLGDTTETNEVPVALIAYYKPELNIGTQDRIDYSELYLDPDIESNCDYLEEEKEAPLMIAQTSRGIETVYYYQVKHAVFVYPGAADIVYPSDNPFLSNWGELADNPEELVSYHQVYDQDVTHVATSGKDNPSYIENTEEQKEHRSVNKETDGKKQLLTLREETEENPAIKTTLYDMEEAFTTKPFYVQGDELSLTAQFENEDFTFYGRENLIWVSSDESIATVKYPDKYLGEDASQYGADRKATIQIVPTGKTGTVYFTLYALNDGIEGFLPVEVCRSVNLYCETGNVPFLKIPSTTSQQAVLRASKGAALDICFSSNVTEQNAKEAKNLDLLETFKQDEYPTELTLKVYEADKDGKAVGQAVYESKEMSTIQNRIAKMSIPEGILNKMSGSNIADYVATIHVKSISSTRENGELKPEYSTLTTTAGICILPERPSVSLGKQESYSILDTKKLTISCEASMENASIAYTSLSIVDSDGTEVFNAPLKEGKNVFTWKPDAMKGTLKKAYVAKATIAAKNQEVPSTDSFVFYVYNHDALDILVDAVKGKNKAGVTDKDSIVLDNHDKIETLLSEDKKTICLDGEDISLAGLRKDINLSAVISINYGDYVWGQISDQISWEVAEKGYEEVTKDLMETPATLNYQQGGAYSNIKAYSYVSYSPSDNFMAVGLHDGETVIQATQVRTGMSSKITITSKSVEDQLYLFKFLPETVTTVEYVNGNEEKCSVRSNENGELAIYEPSGIQSDVNCFSEKDGESYIGTIVNINLVTGEKDISKLQYYPVNNFMLRNVAKADLFIKDENGTPYRNQTVWLRGGVFKNDSYCYTAGIGADSKHVKDGKEDQEFTTDENGKLTIYFDASQFYTREEETLNDRRINTSDQIVYKIEVKFQKDEDAAKVKQAYEPQLVTFDTSVDYTLLAHNCSNSITLRKADKGILKPVINTQEFYQYERESDYLSNETNVYNNTNSVGISYQYPEALLVTETLYWGEEVQREPVVYTDRDGNEFNYGMGTIKPADKLYEVYYQDTDDYQPVNQKNEVVDYPFSDMPVIKTVWTMNKNGINSWIKPIGKMQDGIKSSGETSVKVVMNKQEEPVKEVASTFNVSNTSNVDQVDDKNINKEEERAANELGHGFSAGGVLGEALKDKKLSAAAVFMDGIEADLGIPVSITISPTEDSKVFHAVIQIGEDASTEASSSVIEEDWNEKKKEYDKEKKEKEKKQKEEKQSKLKRSKTETEKKKESPSNIKRSKTENGSSYTAKHQDNSKSEKEKKEEEEKKEPFKRKLGPLELTYGGYLMGNLVYDDKEQEWGFLFVGGGISAGLGYKKELLGGIIMVGPLPFCYNITVSGSLNLDFNIATTYVQENNGTDFLTRVGFSIGIDLFAGIGVDAKAFAIKIGAFGTMSLGNTFAMLNMVNYGSKDETKAGYQFSINGSVGLKFVLKILFFSYKTTLASVDYEFTKEKGYWNEIGDYWENITNGGEREFKVESLADEIMLIQATEESMEDRNYIESFDRDWLGGTVGTQDTSDKNELETVMTNAYPFAEPVYNDDGSIMVYLSDSDSTELEDTLASYAIGQNGSYVNQHGINPVTYVTDQLDNKTGKAGSDGELDPIYDEDGKVINKYRTTRRTGYGDTSLRVAGNRKFSVATWVREQNEIKNDAGEEASYEDLSMMMNGSEIYASVWTGDKWSTTRLTQDTSPDMAPAVAATDRYAIVTWRSVQSSNTENPIDFNVCDNVCAKVYDKQDDTWSDMTVLYNGETGSVNALDAAILEDGTAMAAYGIKTGNDDTVNTDTEVMYSIMNTDGILKNCTRVTNNDQTDGNVEVTTLDFNGEERFVLGWYNEKMMVKNGEDETQQNALELDKDIRLQAIDRSGFPCDDFIESIKQAGAEKISSNFRFSKPDGKANINELSVVWVETEEAEKVDTNTDQNENCFIPNTSYTLSAVRFYQDDSHILVSQPVEMAKMGNGDTIDSFEAYSREDNVYAAIQSTHYEINKEDPSTYTLDQLEHVTEPENGEKGKVERVNVYTPVGVTNLYTAVGKFKLCAVEATKPSIDSDDVRMGFSLPVPFMVKNTGIRKIDKVEVTLAGKTEEFPVTLLPGESTAVSLSYDVPEDKIEDIPYSIVAYSNGKSSKKEDSSGVIELNVPEITMNSVQITEELRKTRTVQIDLGNSGTVPLVHSGKKVVIGLYDSNPDTNTLNGEKAEIQPLATTTIEDEEILSLLDAGAYSYSYTLTQSELDRMILQKSASKDLVPGNQEIPSSGIMLYARAWVENADGTLLEGEDRSDNMGTTVIYSLIDKYGSKESMSSRIEQKEKEINVVVTIKNHSYVDDAHGNVIAVLKNQKGDIISKTKQCFDSQKQDKGIVSVGSEDEMDVTVTFTEDDLLEGHHLEEAVSSFASYGDIDDESNQAKLAKMKVSGQHASLELFTEEQADKEPEVTFKDKEIEVNGEKLSTTLKINEYNYKMYAKLNSEKLDTLISVVPKNPENKIAVSLNAKKMMEGEGAQTGNARLNSQFNNISTTVYGTIYKQMEVTRDISLKIGKLRFRKEQKDYYNLNEFGNPVDDKGNAVNLQADDILDYKEIYVQNVSRYMVTLKGVSYDSEISSLVTKDKEIKSKLSQMFLQAKQTKNACKLTWTREPEADGYLVYGVKYKQGKNANKLKLLKTVKSGKTLTYTHKKLAKNQFYEYMVEAYKLDKGKKVTIGRSYKVFIYNGTDKSKYANPVKITVKKSKLNVKANKKVQIDATAVLPKGKKKKLVVSEIRYLSSNDRIATVSKNGLVKGKKKGSCYVYVIAQNGMWKKVKVTVK